MFGSGQTIRVPLAVADAARGALNAVAYPDEYGFLLTDEGRAALAALDEAIYDAIANDWRDKCRWISRAPARVSGR